MLNKLQKWIKYQHIYLRVKITIYSQGKNVFQNALTNKALNSTHKIFQDKMQNLIMSICSKPSTLQN